MNHHDHRKNAQMQRKRKAFRYVGNTRKGLRRASGQTQKSYSEESRDDNADSTDRGVPLRQYDPKLIRARSWFEGVSTPRNEWNRRLWTKTTLEQASRTSTSKRQDENSRRHPRGANAKTGAYVPIMHMMQGKDSPRKNRANLRRFCKLIP